MNSPNKPIKIRQQKWRDFWSGLIAGFISVTVCNPLDIIRTRLNIMSSPNQSKNKYTGFINAAKTIWREQGWRGLLSWITVFGVPAFNALFFPIYESSKIYFHEKGYSKNISYCLASIVAGGICNIITNPIWVLRTRVMVQYLHPSPNKFNQISGLQILKQMVEKQGSPSLFKGLSASMLSISNAIIYFFLYQHLKENVLHKNKIFNSYYVFLAATISKIISSTATYPMIVVRTILHDHRTADKLTIPGIVKHIYHKNGISGFYGGLKPDLTRIIPSNAILFVTYEYMRRIM